MGPHTVTQINVVQLRVFIFMYYICTSYHVQIQVKIFTIDNIYYNDYNTL